MVSELFSCLRKRYSSQSKIILHKSSGQHASYLSANVVAPCIASTCHSTFFIVDAIRTQLGLIFGKLSNGFRALISTICCRSWSPLSSAFCFATLDRSIPSRAILDRANLGRVIVPCRFELNHYRSCYIGPSHSRLCHIGSCHFGLHHLMFFKPDVVNLDVDFHSRMLILGSSFKPDVVNKDDDFSLKI